MQTAKAGEWYNEPGGYMLLQAGEKESRRAYIDVTTDVANLDDEFKLTVKLPNSSGSESSFTYLVTK